MKVTLDIIPEDAIKQREVELPDRCPECNADLHEFGALRDICWTSTTSACHIEDDTLEYEGESEEYYEAQYTVDFECTSCGKSILKGCLT
jgi:transcription initiation factor IIE alpha subunit